MEQELEQKLLIAYHWAKSQVADIVRGGWRPLIGWVGVYMMMGIAWRIAHGLPLPNVADILGAIVPTMGMAAMRTFEKYTDRRLAFPTGPIAQGPGAAAGAT